MTRRSTPVRLTARAVLPPYALTLLVTGAILYAGPLNPPAGPVASSYKTISEVEPRTSINAANTPGDADSLYKITQPGSYYLTGNITGVAAKHGIEIVASGVSLDLMGFELAGVPGSLDGISATVGVNNIEVRNGSVRSWGDEGLDFTNGGSIGVTDVSVLNCVGFGISINPNSTATRCRVDGNGAGGLATGSNCVVTGCTASGNSGAGGILVFVGCRVVDCTATNNTGDGISANNASTISGCSANDNTSDGISVPNGCTISNCSASFNDAQGFNVGGGCTITDCASSSNFGNGFVAGDGCTLSGCTARANSVRGFLVNIDPTMSGCTAAENTLDGIRVIAGGSVRSCTASSNGGDGISVGPFAPATVTGTAISACSATFNGGDGIQVAQRCSVTGNLCGSNGTAGAGAGIRVLEIMNTIEGNTVNQTSGTGIVVVQNGNFIISNRAQNNTAAYSIAAGNRTGTIVNSEAAMNTAVNSLINIALP